MSSVNVAQQQKKVIPKTGLVRNYVETIPDDPKAYKPPYKSKRGQLAFGFGVSSSIEVYRFTSDDIRVFLNKKARAYVPNAKVELIVEYCEKKKSSPKRSYAALVVALSNNLMQRHGETDILRKMISTDSDHQLYSEIYRDLVVRYRYDREDLEKILKSYKMLDEFQESFGMTEEFIKNMIYWTIPRRQEIDKTKEVWTLFGARPDAIIYDMLEDVMVYDPLPQNLGPDDEPLKQAIVSSPRKGRMEIVQVTPITKGSVEFVVYLHSDDIQMDHNPDLRKLLDSMKK